MSVLIHLYLKKKIKKIKIWFQSALIQQSFTVNDQNVLLEWVFEFYVVAGREHNNSSGYNDSRHARKTMKRVWLL